ncbi:MAG: hypothetical protein ACLSFT_08380 [Ruminococcus callidus]
MLTCFLAAMVILPTAAFCKDNDAQNKSAAHAMPKRVLHSLFHECGFRRLWLGGRNRTSSSRNFGELPEQKLPQMPRKAISGKLES